ncbi:MAG: hypothetical protein NTU81_01110 [Candidatus Nomurabacteria bacterium]|nr:hypothetical protein [Candidatus Nomurabacteria bacterium]
MENINNNPQDVSISTESIESISTQDKTVESNKTEQLELSSEEQLKNLEENINLQEDGISKLTQSIDDTKSKLNEIRESLGLPKEEEDSPSVLFGKDKLEKLQDKQKEL